MNNIMGLVLSFAFVFLIIIISTLLKKGKLINEEGSRKFIHIGVGNWWIIAMLYFDNVIYVSIVPAIFIVLNYLSYKFNLVKAMERQEDNNLGTVYYPISLLILVVFSFGIIDKPYIGAIGIFIMAYGDGLAAIFGKRFKSKKIFHNKTLIGTLTMFSISVVVTTIILLVFNTNNLIISVLLVSLSATLLELYSKKGIDNLTVPLLSSFIYYLIFLLGGI